MIVIEASALVDALVDDPANPELLALVADEELHAPSLLDYEVASALRGHLLGGRLAIEQFDDAVEDFSALRSSSARRSSRRTRSCPMLASSVSTYACCGRPVVRNSDRRVASERRSAMSSSVLSPSGARPAEHPPALAARPWLPSAAAARVDEVSRAAAAVAPADLAARVTGLVAASHVIHDVECVNLNPATNVMNPAAEALLSARLGTRASLGYPGDKYEMGLEAIEQIEVIAAELAAEVFHARYAEVRVGSGALANLYAFLATCEPGDTIIAPPPSIGGHVTHQIDGAAGLYRLTTVPAPIDAARYTVDVDALAELAREVRPRLITIGGSLNLLPHPVAEIREIADSVGAKVLFDAAHQCGIIAGGAWPNPLDDGAHLMTMSTYKSLGGPPGGLIVTNEPDLAQRLEAIAYPGLTANFDAAKTAALAVTLVDWRVAGTAYAAAMVRSAARLAEELLRRDLPVFRTVAGPTTSHQLAIEAAEFGGGQRAARWLRRAGLLTCGIGLPIADVPGDLNGLRLGTPEIVRIGVSDDDLPALAEFIRRGLRDADAAAVAPEVAAWRARFDRVLYTADTYDPAGR